MNQPAEGLLEFSLVRGAPFNRLMQRVGLAGSEPEAAWRLVLILTFVSWVPLLLLSSIDGSAWSGTVALPFLRDAETHARVLLAVPLLIMADSMVHRRMLGVAQQFLERGLIPETGRQAFDAALTQVTRLRSSKLAELLLIMFVYGVGVPFIWRTQVALDLPTWYGATMDGKLQPSHAGWWLGLVTLPVFQFLMFRWYYRQAIWSIFLWKVSRIELKLMPKHPDGAGGIGFLARTSHAFGPLLAAQTIVMSGTIANRIFFSGVELSSYGLSLSGVAVLLLITVLAPLLFFSRKLGIAKQAGLRESGRLIERYVREFDDRWVRGGAGGGTPLLGSPDLQSLADLGNVYAVVRNMRWAPFGPQDVLYLGAAAIAPLLPLALTMFPAEELLDQLITILF